MREIAFISTLYADKTIIRWNDELRLLLNGGWVDLVTWWSLTSVAAISFIRWGQWWRILSLFASSRFHSVSLSFFSLLLSGVGWNLWHTMERGAIIPLDKLSKQWRSLARRACGKSVNESTDERLGRGSLSGTGAFLRRSSLLGARAGAGHWTGRLLGYRRCLLRCYSTARGGRRTRLHAHLSYMWGNSTAHWETHPYKFIFSISLI